MYSAMSATDNHSLLMSTVIGSTSPTLWEASPIDKGETICAGFRELVTVPGHTQGMTTNPVVSQSVVKGPVAGGAAGR